MNKKKPQKVKITKEKRERPQGWWRAVSGSTAGVRSSFQKPGDTCHHVVHTYISLVAEGARPHTLVARWLRVLAYGLRLKR